MDDTVRELYKAHRAAQEKYAYFLLAAAGAAIAFAVTQTQTAALAHSQIPLAFAVLCWGLSFAAGCRHLQYVLSNLYANMSFLKVRAGEMEGIGAHPAMMQAPAEGIRSAMESNSNRANTYGQWQFRLLILGALAFITWHVVEMGLRATHQGSGINGVL